MRVGEQRLRWMGIAQAIPGRASGRTLSVGLFVVLTTVGAYAAIPTPWSSVPMTLQPLFVLLAGALLGPVLGATSMVSYVLLGLSGVPVFAAGQAGMAWLVGPTGGYILAFPAAAFVCGWLAGPGRAHVLRLSFALTAGLALIYLGGASQLALLTGLSAPEAFATGVLPFLGGDLVEVLVALAVASRIRPASLGRD